MRSTSAGSAHCDIGSVEVAALRISVLEIPTLGAAGLAALALLLALGAVAALRRSAAR
ncbi:MAG TPA: IPTL-CTERM sorting domain-containing protein [Thermoanaerobaculia bacterium]|nr:IPTL-CTERM sorting domain-containing protein [Thermoanaerobaculia bacterium]